jgi:hypothetical protein
MVKRLVQRQVGVFFFFFILQVGVFKGKLGKRERAKRGSEEPGEGNITRAGQCQCD